MLRAAPGLRPVAFGAARLLRRGQVAGEHRDRVLPLTADGALRAGELMALAEAAGRDPVFEDAAIAATAERHGLVVLTRNVRDFLPLGVAHLDPFAALPPEGAGGSGDAG
jgi:predicted nucleic acid-binding protein